MIGRKSIKKLTDTACQTEIAMVKILNKHGIQDSEALEQWFEEGRIPEAGARVERLRP